MRTICLGLALALCLGIAGCDNHSSPKIGVVDLNRLMAESVPGKAGLQYIESQQKELQARLDAIQERIEKNPNDEAAMQELQTVYTASQQKIQTEGQAVVTRLLEAIQKTVDTFRKDNGYSMLIRKEALDAVDPDLDVTETLMAEINKLELNFAPAQGTVKQEPAQEKSGEAGPGAGKEEAEQKQ